MSENINLSLYKFPLSIFQFHSASLLFSAQDGAHGVGVAALKIQAIVEAALLTEDLKTTALVPHGQEGEWMAKMALLQVFEVFIKLK